ncbi:MAG TPA: hypothetical protein VNX26_06615 [Candidatus Acidoferrum sp.]|jgi:hypothetical protein|nr:hypothetical protein [Candidatus Acidoferrum sp.]
MAAEQQIADDTYDLVRQAIIDKNIVIASYRGYVREMCPHVIGKKNGHAQTLLYQFAGGSSQDLEDDGSPANWRCLRVAGLSGVFVRKSTGEWHSASNYSAMQTCVDEIDVKV